MPINSGRIGVVTPRALQGRRFLRGRAFRSPSFATYSASITGVTKDSAGAALAGCVVDLFVAGVDTFVASVTSDGSGNYAFYPTVSGPFYIVAYKAGSPDVAGTTANTLTAA